MRTRPGILLAAIFTACAGSEPAPTLSVSPSGTVQSAGPTVFTADPVALAGSVQWTLTGPGTISGTTGRTVVYSPPPQVDPSQTATLTAAASGQSVSVTIKPQPPVAQAGAIPGLHGAVQVSYDAQQIPHVFCTNILDCFAAQGYLQAQDRLFQMDFYRRVARGRLSSLIGAIEFAQDQQLITLFTTRDGKRLEDAIVAALDADTKAKLDAYVSGINAYLTFLSAHPSLMPQEYAQLSASLTPGDIPPWTDQDTAALARLQQFQLSETIEKETAYGAFALVYGTGTFGLADPAKIAAYIRPQQPVDGFTLSPSDTNLPAAPPASTQGTPAPDPALLQGLGAVNAQMRSLLHVFGNIHDGVGSNNWVVSGSKSATGHAMVANDPHLSLEYPSLFHLIAMTASDNSGLSLAGGSFPGIPGALVGRGAHVGWGVTVVGYDVTDIYQESWVAPGSSAQCPSQAAAGCVTFNGNPVPIQAYQVPVTVRGVPNHAPVTVLMVPHHGPIVHFDTTHGVVLSARWTGQEVTNDFKAFFGLNTAASVDAAMTALSSYEIGAQNFVLADDQGHIAYDPHAMVPRRAWLENPANWGDTTRYPWLPLPGTGTAEWGSGSAGDNCAGTGANAPVIVNGPCWVADAQLPQGKDPAKGYFATANSDPRGYTSSANPYAPFLPPDASTYPYLSFDWDDPTDVRYWRIATLLSQKTAGSNKMSVADMQAVQSDHALYLAKLFDPLYPDPASVSQPAYTAATTLLTAWKGDGFDCPTGLTGVDPSSAPVTDATQLRDSAACFLFHVFIRTAIHKVFDDDMAVVNAKAGSFGADQGAELRALLYMLKSGTNTSFCNDVNPSTGATTATHTCGDQVVAAMTTAWGTLTAKYGSDTNKWIWGRAHTLTTKSPLSPLVGSAFSAGPYARPGGALTVDVASPSLSASDPADMSYGHGPQVRFVSEMNPDLNASVVKMQLPGPEKDGPHGVFANDPDLLGQWVRNQYFDYLIGHQVDSKVVSSQGF